MEKAFKTTEEYKHFLRYDQICFDGIEYGFTDLFYDIRGSSLFIRKVDHRNNGEKEFDISIENINAKVEVVLEEFLINLMSFRNNFEGEPSYENSNIFSKESFDSMLDKGITLMIERDNLAITLNSENELINYCKSQGLNPESKGGSATNWKANCPSGSTHKIMISTVSNEWGCGYCRRKGDINSLKEWLKKGTKGLGG